jgi:hypothetical protein
LSGITLTTAVRVFVAGSLTGPIKPAAGRAFVASLEDDPGGAVLSLSLIDAATSDDAWLLRDDRPVTASFAGHTLVSNVGGSACNTGGCHRAAASRSSAAFAGRD